jgi:hypothetical protein
VHEAEYAWDRSLPANPCAALAEIAEKVFTKADRAEIQRLEDANGELDALHKEHCSAEKFDQAAWDLAQDINLLPEDYAKGLREIENRRQSIPVWQTCLTRKGADLNERLRPFSLKLAVELPGRIAKAINELEKAGGPDGSMAYWQVSQGFDSSTIINPLRRLHSLAEQWLESLKSNDAEAKESRIRAILADSGVLTPRVPVFRRQY